MKNNEENTHTYDLEAQDKQRVFRFELYDPTLMELEMACELQSILWLADASPFVGNITGAILALSEGWNKIKFSSDKFYEMFIVNQWSDGRQVFHLTRVKFDEVFLSKDKSNVSGLEIRFANRREL